MNLGHLMLSRLSQTHFCKIRKVGLARKTIHLACVASALLLSYDNRTTTTPQSSICTAFLAQFPVGEEPGYKAGSTYILGFAQRGFIAGSHSVCAVRNLLRVDRKIISIRSRRNSTEWFKSSHLISEVLFNIALYPGTSPTGNCANPFNIASYPGSSPVFLQGRSLGMRLC